MSWLSRGAYRLQWCFIPLSRWQLHHTEGQVCKLAAALQPPHLLQLLPKARHRMHCCQQQRVLLLSQLPHLGHLPLCLCYCGQQLRGESTSQSWLLQWGRETQK